MGYGIDLEKYDNNKLNFINNNKKYFFIKPYYRNNDELFKFIEENIEGEYISYVDLKLCDQSVLSSYFEDIKENFGELKLKIYKLAKNECNEKFFYDEKANEHNQFPFILLEENSGFIYANTSHLYIWLSIARGVSDEEFKNCSIRISEYYFHLRSYFEIYDEKLFK